MKKSDTHAFVNQLVVCLLVTISCGSSIGFGTVWMRHQNDVTAAGNRALTAQISVVERQIEDTTTQIEGEQTSDLLRQRNEAWRIGLQLVREEQTLRVAGDPVRRLRDRASRESFDVSSSSSGIRFALAQ